MGPRHRDLVGEQFGRLVVIAYAGRTGTRVAMWRCRCECGNERAIRAASLVHNRTTSCGCFNKERVRETHTRHGAYRSRLYAVWSQMIGRCSNPRNKVYALYGGRGIVVCYRWRQFEAFRDDMGEPPTGCSLERKDNDGNYEPGNCRWATPAEQALNTRRNINVTINGVTRTVSEWSAIYGVKRHTASIRIQRGWDRVAAVSTAA